MLEIRGWGHTAAAMLVASVLVGCSLFTSRPNAPAPVEDRSAGSRGHAPVSTPVLIPAAPGMTGAENAGRPGYYTVRPGDTLIRIALDSGQNWRDIARWNNVENPNVIEVGQVLRVIPPGGAMITETASRPASQASTAAVPAGAAASAAGASAIAPRPGTSAPVVASISPSPGITPPVPVAAEDELPWAWPIAGSASVLAGFDEQRNKGLDIAGKAGDPVLASADGRVVYAGAGLRGYGNLVILKHNNTYLSAYAHNQVLLVKEDQTVRKGQKIAEMGNSDADRVKLHFEIRRQGKPVDPSRYLPGAAR